MDATTARRGGRGARERILAAATELFHHEGIHATGVARLTEVAHVSTRTFYQHFPSKGALVEEYLRRLEATEALSTQHALAGSGTSPRDRILAVFFAALHDSDAGVVRGCPFHNAAVEAAAAMPEITGLVREHKAAFRRRLAETAAEAGAEDPHRLARRLAVLYEGATALATSCNDDWPFAEAGEMAAELIDAALGRPSPGSRG